MRVKHFVMQFVKRRLMNKSYKKELLIGSSIIVGILALIVAIVLVIQNSGVKIVYQPTSACELLTIYEARELLGNATIQSNISEPVLSGNTATSRCGYTDGNANQDELIVAAVMVRSGINDKGVEQNKTEFKNGRPIDNTETIENLGDAAYFNSYNGQLNILDGYNWIVLSYGVGSAMEANNLEDAVRLGQKVVN